MSTPTARPKQMLDLVSKRFPNAWKGIQLFLNEPPVPWPSWCFMPMAAFYTIVSEGGRLDVDEIFAMQELAALGTWRYTQGIYRIDPALVEHIAQTPFDGDLPCDALMHFPEWCIYIESPNMTFAEIQTYGFFAHLEYDINSSRQELRLLFDTADGLMAMPIHLGGWSLGVAIKKMTAEAIKQGGAPELLTAIEADANLAQATSSIAPFLSLLLYVLSQANDITSQDGIKPSNPTPKKVKGGVKLFAAEKPRTWDVGTRMGAALRRAYHAQQQGGSEGQGSVVQPHIRRAHWHGYWVGPKDGPRKFDLRWLPPIAVNLDDVGDLPATIRPVK